MSLTMKPDPRMGELPSGNRPAFQGTQTHSRSQMTKGQPLSSPPPPWGPCNVPPQSLPLEVRGPATEESDKRGLLRFALALRAMQSTQHTQTGGPAGNTGCWGAQVEMPTGMGEGSPSSGHGGQGSWALSVGNRTQPPFGCDGSCTPTQPPSTQGLVWKEGMPPLTRMAWGENLTRGASRRRRRDICHDRVCLAEGGVFSPRRGPEHHLAGRR